MKTTGFLYFLLLSLGLAAQSTHTLRARVQAEGQDIDFAEALLLQIDSDSLVAYATVTDGVLTFPDLLPNTYLLRILALGYNDWSQTVTVPLTDEPLQVKLQAGIDLAEVTVTESRQQFVYEQGNLRMNVADTPLASNPSSLDLLEDLPGVLLSPDRQSVQVVGQGTPLIYIGNQPSNLSELVSIPVTDIESVELIYNPSAKYEAAGQVVLLVRLREQRSEGYRVEFSEVFARRFGNNNYLTGNANWHRGKWLGRVNTAYHQLQPLEVVLGEFSDPARAFSGSYQTQAAGQRAVYLAGAGLAFEPNPQHYLAVNVRGRVRDGRGTPTTVSEFQQGETTEELYTLTNQLDPRQFLSSDLRYTYEQGSTELFLAGRQSWLQRDAGAYVRNGNTLNNLVPIQQRDQLFRTQRYNFRADLSQQLLPDLRLETGAQWSHAQATTNQHIQTLSDGNTDNTRYELQETIGALYAETNYATGPWALRAGLRTEYTYSRGRVNTQTSPLLDRRNTFVLPSANLVYQIDSLHSATLTYRRTIERPRFNQLSLVEFYINPFTVIRENPNLQANRPHLLALGYQWQHRHDLRLQWYQQLGPFLYNTVYDDERDLYVLTRRNFERAQELSLVYTLNLSYGRWQSVYFIRGAWERITNPDASSSQVRPYLYAYVRQQFRLPFNSSISAQAFGFSQRWQGVLEQAPLYSVELQLDKRFGERLSATLAWKDIFDGLQFENTSTILGITSSQTFDIDSEEISLAIRYQFGQTQRQMDEREIEEDANRVND